MKKLGIFLGGEQGSGKSTAAAVIERALLDSGWLPNIIKFADPLYEMHNELEKKFSSYLGRNPQKKNGPLLQILGTDIGRNLYDKDIWVKAATDRVKQDVLNARRLNDYNPSAACEQYAAILEDVRFENEFDMQSALKADGFETLSIYFEAPLEARRDRVESFRTNTSHQSEAELAKFKDRFDYKIDTAGTIEEKNKILLKILCDKGLLKSPEEVLAETVGVINDLLENWSETTGYGANFDWVYDERGRKRLKVRNAAPIEVLPEDLVARATTETEKTLAGMELLMATLDKGQEEAKELDGPK